jgi:hypothetical protein
VHRVCFNLIKMKNIVIILCLINCANSSFGQPNLVFDSIASCSKRIWTPTKNVINTFKFNTTNLDNSVNQNQKGYDIQSGSIKKKYILKDANAAFSQGLSETMANNYVLIGQTIDTIGINLHYRLTLTGIDNNYNQLWKKSFGNNKFVYFKEYFASIPLIKKGNFLYSTLFAFDSLNKQPGIFIKFNYSGDTVWQKKYYVQNHEVFLTNLCTSTDNGFFLVGAIQNTTPGYNGHPIVGSYLIKTNANGDTIWTKKIYMPSLDNTQISYAVLQDSITKRIILTGFQSNTSGSYSNLLLLDSLGNKIIQSPCDNTRGSALIDVIKLKDGNYLASGSIRHDETKINNIPTTASFLLKFNINGTILFKKEYDSLVVNNVISKVLEDEDGCIYTGGALTTMQQYNVGANDVSRIMKVDKNGNMLWKEYYDNYTGVGNNSNQDGLSDMKFTQDKKIIFTNYFIAGNTPKPLNYIFFKIDTTYCDINAFDCSSFVGLKENSYSKDRFTLFPNPATNNCQLDFSQIQQYNSVSIEVKNIFGQVIYKTFTNTLPFNLNTSEYSNGLYFVGIKHKGIQLAEQKLIIVK